ncbi:MAG: hypothetical protein AAF251_12990 [Pseudomonadota bacterium]
MGLARSGTYDQVCKLRFQSEQAILKRLSPFWIERHIRGILTMARGFGLTNEPGENRVIFNERLLFDRFSYALSYFDITNNNLPIEPT